MSNSSFSFLRKNLFFFQYALFALFSFSILTVFYKHLFHIGPALPTSLSFQCPSTTATPGHCSSWNILISTSERKLGSIQSNSCPATPPAVLHPALGPQYKNDVDMLEQGQGRQGKLSKGYNISSMPTG